MIKSLLFGGAGTGTKSGDAGLMVMRVFAGLAMALAHGLKKVKDPSDTLGMAKGMGMPMAEVMGYLAIAGEFLGGILLALGLFTRPMAVFIGAIMFVAGFIFHGNDPFQKQELAFMYLVIMLVFAITGGGRFSVDSLITGKK